jgi:hypothetical protein
MNESHAEITSLNGHFEGKTIPLKQVQKHMKNIEVATINNEMEEKADEMKRQVSRTLCS